MCHRRLLEAVAEVIGHRYVDSWRELRRPSATCFSTAPVPRSTHLLQEPLRPSAHLDVRFHGMLDSLERRYENTDSDNRASGSGAHGDAAVPRVRWRPPSARDRSPSRSAASTSQAFTRQSAKAALEWV